MSEAVHSRGGWFVRRQWGWTGRTRCPTTMSKKRRNRLKHGARRQNRTPAGKPANAQTRRSPISPAWIGERSASWLDRYPRYTAFGHLAFATLTGFTIGLIASWLVAELQTGLSEPYPYIVNVMALLLLQTVVSWLWFFIKPFVDHIIRSGRIAVVRRRSVIAASADTLQFPVKYDQGTMLKTVMVLETTLATYLTSHPIEPPDLFGMPMHMVVLAILGGAAMAMLTLSQTTIIHAMVRGKHWYQMERG